MKKVQSLPGKVQIETPMRCYHTPRRMHRVLVELWGNWRSRPLLVGMQNDTATLGNRLTISYTSSTELSNHLGVYLRELETYVHTVTCT